MMSMMGSSNMTEHMSSGMNHKMTDNNTIQDGMMMGNNTRMMHDNMMMELMKEPETREKMIELMKEHISEMNELFSSNLSDDEFNMKMVNLMQDHMQSMQDLMTRHQMTGMMHP
jgi:non-homologous end joining protein Ku